MFIRKKIKNLTFYLLKKKIQIIHLLNVKLNEKLIMTV